MPSRDTVARGLIMLREWWPSMPDSVGVVDALLEECGDFTDAEFLAGIRTVRGTHESASTPKPLHIKRAVASAAGRLRAEVIAQSRVGLDLAYCPECRTTILEWSPLWPSGHARMIPRHEAGCPRQFAEAQIPGPVRMDLWPNDRKTGKEAA